VALVYISLPHKGCYIKKCKGERKIKPHHFEVGTTTTIKCDGDKNAKV